MQTKFFLNAFALTAITLGTIVNTNAQVTYGTGGSIGANSPTTNLNVGIGTNAPAVNLDIRGRSTDYATGLDLRGTNTYLDFLVYNQGSNANTTPLEASGTNNIRKGDAVIRQLLNTTDPTFSGNLHLNIPSTGNTGSRAVLIGDNTRTTMGVFDNGRVGIGTMAPTQLLQLGDEWVFHNGSTKYIGRNVTYVPVAGGSWQNVTMRANQASSLMAFDTDGSIRFENNSSTSMPVGSIANTITRLNISNQGKVSIGNVTTPGDYRLYVEKGILTEKVRVALKTTTNWADYVFAPDYKLKPLAEVEAFVKENKHLPNVPSAEQLVKDGGIDVNEMFAKQMEKIEELTLYIIEQNKKADAQNKQIEQLQTRISQLEKQ